MIIGCLRTMCFKYRGCRRDAMEAVKAEKKAGTCSEDDVKKLEKEIQKLTDKYVESVEKILEDKTKELTTM